MPRFDWQLQVLIPVIDCTSARGFSPKSSEKTDSTIVWRGADWIHRKIHMSSGVDLQLYNPYQYIHNERPTISIDGLSLCMSEIRVLCVRRCFKFLN